MKSWRGIMHVFSFGHWRKALLPRHILRDRRPGTTACPGCWATGTYKVKKGAVRKTIFCTGTMSPTNQPGKDPFHLHSTMWVPHLPQFQPETQNRRPSMTACPGATPLWSLWFQQCWTVGYPSLVISVCSLCKFTSISPLKVGQLQMFISCPVYTWCSSFII